MAGGGAVASASPNAGNYNYKFNMHIVLTAIVGASAGLLFGYDIGVRCTLSFPPGVLVNPKFPCAPPISLPIPPTRFHPPAYHIQPSTAWEASSPCHHRLVD